MKLLHQYKSHGKSCKRRVAKQVRLTLLDGWHLVQEAIQHDGKLHAIMATPEQLAEHQDDLPLGVPVFEITADIAKKLSDLVTPQGIFAEVSLPTATS